jgi:hypothetical protein
VPLLQSKKQHVGRKWEKEKKKAATFVAATAHVLQTQNNGKTFNLFHCWLKLIELPNGLNCLHLSKTKPTVRHAMMDPQSILKQMKQVEVWEALGPILGKNLSKEGLKLEA